MTINLKKSWWLLLLALVIMYPISAEAAQAVARVYGAPFLFSWSGIWLFSLAGGFGAGFVRIEDIDKQLSYPWVAKTFIGCVSGVALCMFLSQDAANPKPALTFWALIASGVSAPIAAGALVYLSNQNRMFGWFDFVVKRRTGYSDKGGQDDNADSR